MHTLWLPKEKVWDRKPPSSNPAGTLINCPAPLDVPAQRLINKARGSRQAFSGYCFLSVFTMPYRGAQDSARQHGLQLTEGPAVPGSPDLDLSSCSRLHLCRGPQGHPSHGRGKGGGQDGGFTSSPRGLPDPGAVPPGWALGAQPVPRQVSGPISAKSPS